MATPPQIDRISMDRPQRARTAARRRAARARFVAGVSAAALAWCAHAAHAAAAMQQAPSAERQPLGASAPAVPGAGGGMEFVRLVGALAVVVALAFVARWWIRRTGLARPFQGGAFEVVSRHPMGGGQSVLVARFGPRLLCIQHGRDGMRTLCELGDPAEVAAALADVRGTGAVRGEPVRTVDLRRKDVQA